MLPFKKIMKVKKFNNLWTMGFVIFGVILGAFYLAKIFMPNLIVGIAEIPEIVAFGNFVDANWWAYYLFNATTSFFIMFFFGCACCKIKCLNLIEIFSLIGIIIISYIVELLLPSQLFTYNVCSYFIFVLIIVLNRKMTDSKIVLSTIICYLITAFSQSLSLEIRGIITLINYPNTATYTILLIDAYIWNILLYLYYNYKGEK